MGFLSLLIPQVGLSDSTEDPKVASNFTSLQTLLNGNVDDTNLSSPNNAVRRLLLQAQGMLVSPAGAANYLFTSSSPTAANAATGSPAPLWIGDSGVTGQPTDFQVANKTALARLRASITTNAILPGMNVNVGLFSVTAAPGVGGGQVAYSFGGMAQLVAFTTPADKTLLAAETAQFTLPTTGFWGLGIFTASALPAGCAIAASAQLYGYNA